MDILRKEKFSTATTLKTNDIIVTDEDSDRENVVELKESCSTGAKIPADDGDGTLMTKRNTWVQCDRCYRVRLKFIFLIKC